MTELNQEAYTRIRHIDNLDAPKDEHDPELQEIKELAALKIRKPVGD